MKVKINYEESYKYNFKKDVKGAVKHYMNDRGLEYFDSLGHITEIGEGYLSGLILYPQALNPFLKIMETLGETKNIVILPAFNNDDKELNISQSAYLILKFPLTNKMVNSVNIDDI